MNEFDLYENLTRFRWPLIERMVGSLDIVQGSKGIDIGCGIGSITGLLSQKTGPGGEVTGLDFSNEMIRYAREHTKQKNLRFVQGDVSSLALEPASFDWIWSMDTIWAGPTEYGCPAAEPGHMLNQLYRILKPGSKIYLSYWSAQKLLPGHPLLEARLNTSASANAPYVKGMDPDHHVLFGRKWLLKAGFADVEARSFAGDVAGPLNKADKAALASLFDMLWAPSENELPAEDREEYLACCSPASVSFVPDDPGYYGFYIYTLFQGTKKK